MTSLPLALAIIIVSGLLFYLAYRRGYAAGALMRDTHIKVIPRVSGGEVTWTAYVFCRHQLDWIHYEFPHKSPEAALSAAIGYAFQSGRANTLAEIFPRTPTKTDLPWWTRVPEEARSPFTTTSVFGDYQRMFGGFYCQRDEFSSVVVAMNPWKPSAILAAMNEVEGVRRVGVKTEPEDSTVAGGPPRFEGPRLRTS